MDENERKQLELKNKLARFEGYLDSQIKETKLLKKRAKLLEQKIADYEKKHVKVKSLLS